MKDLKINDIVINYPRGYGRSQWTAWHMLAVYEALTEGKKVIVAHPDKRDVIREYLDRAPLCDEGWSDDDQ